MALSHSHNHPYRGWVTGPALEPPGIERDGSTAGDTGKGALGMDDSARVKMALRAAVLAGEILYLCKVRDAKTAGLVMLRIECKYRALKEAVKEAFFAPEEQAADQGAVTGEGEA